MKDQFDRKIDYMRISVTDRCNLRCQYCMPQGISLEQHDDILSYEEIMHVCKAAVSLGIVRFKITGGEPLVRKGCVDFIASLKELPGVEQVTLTTNGILLPTYLDALVAAGIDGVNVSLDTLDNEQYQKLTGSKQATASQVIESIENCAELGIKTKVNSVLLAQTNESLTKMAALAVELPLSVRFIELMPIGTASVFEGIPMDEALECLQGVWPDLHPDHSKQGNGPARYYASAKLKGRIGFIDAVSHSFCEQCNRVRLTATGRLKLCLCYDDELDVKEMLRNNVSAEELQNAIKASITTKPRAHCFSEPTFITEQSNMNQIGG